MESLRGHVLLIIPASSLLLVEELRLQEMACLVIDQLEYGQPRVVKDRIRNEGTISRYDTLSRVATHLVSLEDNAL